MSVEFHADSSDGRYDVLEWRSVTRDSTEESSPAVWDGSELV